MSEYDFTDIINWAKENKKGTPPDELLLPLFKYYKKTKNKGRRKVSLPRRIGITKSRFAFWIKFATKVESGKKVKRKKYKKKSKREIERLISVAHKKMLIRRTYIKVLMRYNLENDLKPKDAFSIALNLMDTSYRNDSVPEMSDEDRLSGASGEVAGEPELEVLE